MRGLLNQVSLFSGLGQGELEALQSLAKRLSLPENTILFQEGDPANHFFIVEDGVLEVIKKDNQNSDHILATLEGDEIIGEMTLIESQPRSATIRAKTPVTLIEFDCASIRAQAFFYKITTELIKTMSERLRRNNDKTVEAMQHELDEIRKSHALLQRAEAEIRQLNAALERKVEERTRTIATILNNVKSGFFLVNKEIQILDGFTKSCHGILGLEVREAMPLAEALRLQDRERFSIEFFAGLVFDDMMPPAASLANLRVRYNIGEKVVAMEGAVVRGDDGKVEAILFTVTDATDLSNAEMESQKNKTLLNILKNKFAFRNYLEDTKAKIDFARDGVDEDQIEEILADLHTIKGNSAIFGLTQLADFVHQLEEKPTITKADVDSLESLLVRFLKEHYEVIGISYHQLDEREVTVSLKDLEEIRCGLVRAELSRVPLVFDSWRERVTAKPVGLLLGPLEKSVQTLAKRFGKEVRFTLEGGDVLVSPDLMGGVIQNLIHMVRNSIDHGIESPAERGDKPPVGSIEVSVSEDEGHFRVQIKDDGRGIDVPRVMEKAIEQGLRTQKELSEMTEMEIQKLIFAFSLSTATEVSTVSGRGFGMSALDAVVGDLGGHIVIDSHMGLGTCFTILIPKNSVSLKAVL